MEYVWYASYGSNLNRERFLCYIQGGQPKGSKDVEVGCRDRSLPKRDEPITLPFSLYFSGYAERWRGAPAFIGHGRSDTNRTLGRMYLITREQFIDVVRQENNGVELDLNLESIKRDGSQTFRQSWYGHIVYVGQRSGIPIYTFTAPWAQDAVEFASPSKEYLGTIIEGIKQIHKLKNEKIKKYLMNKPGIKGMWSSSDMEELIRSR